jgi:hypothetical protein
MEKLYYLMTTLNYKLARMRSKRKNMDVREERRDQ